MVRNTINEAIPATKTRGEIARAAGIRREYLQQLLTGNHIPSVEVALRIARALNTSVEDLYELIDGPRCDERELRRRAKAALAPGGGTGGDNCTRIPQAALR
jgi:transcriptional regulator with XRE-family HTH domain